MRAVAMTILFVSLMSAGASFAQDRPRIDARRAPAPAATPIGPTVSAAPDAAAPSTAGKPIPGGANSSPNRTGNEAVADCMQLWDKGTHMTKQEWAITCRRVQGRVDNLNVDPVMPKAPSKRP